MSTPTTLNLTDAVGVVGAGTMGRGIAQVAATAGHPVYIYDAYDEALEDARQFLDYIINRQVEKERMSRKEADAILDRINFVETLEPFADCTLCIEAVVEDLEVKQDTLQRLEAMVPRSSILATNTSSLSIAALSSVLKKPARFLGTHFFNPAPLLPLVEVVAGLPTGSQIADTVFELMKKWDKTPVRAKDTPGFIVNRVARPFYGEALRIYEEGIAEPATIDWAMKEHGFRMGPFELMDLIGNDVNYKVSETVFEAFYYDPRFRPSFAQKRLVEAGWLGRKSGRGFYEYGDDANNPEPNKDEALAGQIFLRIIAMLINEAADAVFMNVATPEDVDRAMTQGVNYPKGLLAWGEEMGLSVVLEQIEELQQTYGEDRYRPCPLLRRITEANGSFFSHRF